MVGIWKIFLAKIPAQQYVRVLSSTCKSSIKQQPQNSRVLRHNNKTRSRSTIPTSHDTRIKISLVARPLLTSPAQKLCRYEHDKLSARRCIRAAATAAVRILSEVRSHAVTRAMDTGISWHKQQFDDSQSLKTHFIFWPEGSEQIRHTADCQIQPTSCAVHNWLSAV